MSVPLRAGDLLRVDGCASVQFGGACAPTLRVVAVLRDRPTFDGWIWLAGYTLDDDGLATAERELFVRVAGLHPLRQARAPVRCPRAGGEAGRVP